MTALTPRLAVCNLSPYVPGRPIEEIERDFGVSGAIKLASNENPLGPSPLALAAAQEALLTVNMYPDGSATLLRRKLAQRTGLSPEQVILGAGASELIDITLRTYLDAGLNIVMPEGTFRMFHVAAGRAGATLKYIPTKSDYRPDLAAMLAAVDESTRIVAIANPNNPTGAYVSRDDLRAFVSQLPSHVLMVLDEAYFDFAYGIVPDYPNGLDLLAEGRQIVVLRTFSKISGLAGLRLGYGFGPEETIASMHKVREPFNANSVAQAAALAALDDEDHKKRVRDLVCEERAFVFAELQKRPVKVYPSIGNFLLIETDRPFEPLNIEFLRRGVILRPMAGWGYTRGFRVSIGTHAENTRFLEVFDELIALGFLGAVDKK